MKKTNKQKTKQQQQKKKTQEDKISEIFKAVFLKIHILLFSKYNHHYVM